MFPGCFYVRIPFLISVFDRSILPQVAANVDFSFALAKRLSIFAGLPFILLLMRANFLPSAPELPINTSRLAKYLQAKRRFRERKRLLIILDNVCFANHPAQMVILR